MSFKTAVKSLLRSFGYEIRRLPRETSMSTNAYETQRVLLDNQEVHVIFDVGANIGETVSVYKKLFPNVKIYCFEPFEECFRTLWDTYKQFSFIKPYKLAVTDISDRKKFFFNANNGTNSLLPVAAGCDRYVDANEMVNLGSIDVQTTTLDDFCLKEHIENIQILKMDIQGGELMALQGATSLLKMQSIDLIYTEVLFVPLYEKQANFCDLYEFLDRYGYTLYGLYDLNYGKKSLLAWGDAIFISSKIEELLS